MSKTKIEWAEHVWNPITGCTRVGEGCRNCYALRQFGRGLWDYGEEVMFHPERLDKPMRRRIPTHYFVCSMGDLFHEDVPDEWVESVMVEILESYDRHTFTVLTKRPDRMRNYFKHFYGPKSGMSMPHNLHLYVSVWDQESADRFIPILLDTPAAVRGVSIEPMLGAITLPRRAIYCDGCGYTKNDKAIQMDHHLCRYKTATLDHVILGGETGPGARVMDRVDAERVKDQCVAAGVPFFYKGRGTAILPKSHPNYMLLDGRKWEEMPCT